ncbi:MAG: HAD family hydrolase [Chitinispirillia bacterium]|nr:HAD family hydrolase [Chitinispirillia bacterium]
MSDLAEYARRLHESERRVYQRTVNACGYECAHGELRGVRAAIFDVYGTMVNYWRPGFESRELREGLLLEAFGEIASRFGMEDVLMGMNPGDSPAKTLSDFYNGLLALNHQKSVKKGIEFPEVRVDEVWSVIVLMLKRNGYDAAARAPGDAGDFARYLAYTYNFLSMGRSLYPGVADALKRLKGDNIVLGILSDAQLYTPIDLTLLLRDQSGGTVDDHNELFDADLTFLSYEYGFVKPGEVLFRRLFDALYEYRITPDQTVFVGNDLSVDIKPAAALGMRTALFCGDDVMLFGGDAGVVPDIVFRSWGELADKINFHGETGVNCLNGD